MAASIVKSLICRNFYPNSNQIGKYFKSDWKKAGVCFRIAFVFCNYLAMRNGRPSF